MDKLKTKQKEMSDKDFNKQWFMQRPPRPIHWYITEFQMKGDSAQRMSRELKAIIELMGVKGVDKALISMITKAQEYLEQTAKWATEEMEHLLACNPEAKKRKAA